MLVLPDTPPAVVRFAPQPNTAQQPNVSLQRQGLQTRVSMHVAVPLPQAWAVLTDYQRSFGAMPDVASVSLVSRQGQRLRLRQVLQAPYTFGLRITALLDGEEHPSTGRLHYALVQGDHIRALSGHWTLTPEAGGTRIVHVIRLEPEVPPLLMPTFRGLHDTSLKQGFETLRRLLLSAAGSDQRSRHIRTPGGWRVTR